MNNKLKNSALIFLGTLGLTLIIVKAFGLFNLSIEWLYIPGVIAGVAVAVYTFIKK